MLLPPGAHRINKVGIARLPIIAADIVQLVGCEMVRQSFVGDVENHRKQAAHIFLIPPPHQRQRGIAAFGGIHFLVLIARAVIHAITIDQGEVLNDQILPGVIYEGLWRVHVHPASNQRLPR